MNTRQRIEQTKLAWNTDLYPYSLSLLNELDLNANEETLKKNYDTILAGTMIFWMKSYDKQYGPQAVNNNKLLYPISYHDLWHDFIYDYRNGKASREAGSSGPDYREEKQGEYDKAFIVDLGTKALAGKLPFAGKMQGVPDTYFDHYHLKNTAADLDTTRLTEEHNKYKAESEHFFEMLERNHNNFHAHNPLIPNANEIKHTCGLMEKTKDLDATRQTEAYNKHKEDVTLLIEMVKRHYNNFHAHNPLIPNANEIKQENAAPVNSTVVTPQAETTAMKKEAKEEKTNTPQLIEKPKDLDATLQTEESCKQRATETELNAQRAAKEKKEEERALAEQKRAEEERNEGQALAEQRQAEEKSTLKAEEKLIKWLRPFGLALKPDEKLKHDYNKRKRFYKERYKQQQFFGALAQLGRAFLVAVSAVSTLGLALIWTLPRYRKANEAAVKSRPLQKIILAAYKYSNAVSEREKRKEVLRLTEKTPRDPQKPQKLCIGYDKEGRETTNKDKFWTLTVFAEKHQMQRLLAPGLFMNAAEWKQSRENSIKKSGPVLSPKLAR